MEFNWKKLCLIQTSACISESATYPIDYIKTKMQINLQKKTFIDVSKDILYSKRKIQMYDGLKPALLRHCFYTTFRVNMYENLRDSSHINNKFLIGGLSGGVSQLITSPFDLLKIRYITDMKENTTIPKTIRDIYRENGIRGLWKGVGPNVWRAILVNLGELATYDIVKRKIKTKLNVGDSIYLHLSSSICSGFVSSLCCTPADVIKSRMMQTNSHYDTMSQCIIGTVRKEGFLSLYKGFFPVWIRLAPWQMIFWVSYEKLRKISGLESF